MPVAPARRNGHDSFHRQDRADQRGLADGPGSAARRFAGDDLWALQELTVAANRYRIVLRGRLSKRFESAFEGMTMEHAPGRTVLIGEVRDQAQLYGVLDQVRDLGVERSP
jgi:hypothetical protein